MALCHSFESIAEELALHAEGLWEQLVFPRDLQLIEGQMRVPRPGYWSTSTLTPYAQRQVAEFWRIPVRRFALASGGEQDAMFAEAMERLIFPAHRMITLRGQHRGIRAIVDELCMPFYHRTLLRALWQWRRRFQVQWFSHDAFAMHLRLVDPESLIRIARDEYLLAGVHIGHSEVGFRPLTVDPLILRLNTGSGVIGFATDRSTLSVVPRWDGDDIEDLLQGAVEAALTAATDGLIGFADMRNCPITQPERFLEKIYVESYMPGSFLSIAQGYLANESKEHRHSLFGVVSALCRGAHGLRPETRLKIESIVGRTLPIWNA